ncbi:hypothetical protein NDU88_005512 [Pleurodeles waltl]|uniref:Uncharacterized protein n=1 Tax=Pleurodeles waltl TaxID=8319 RepID=A0AAV7M9I2_PLEWA|nr:hypothetical protein NDU88_005512 [Pleurodeles waltl]
MVSVRYAEQCLARCRVSGSVIKPLKQCAGTAAVSLTVAYVDILIIGCQETAKSDHGAQSGRGVNAPLLGFTLHVAGLSMRQHASETYASLHQVPSCIPSRMAKGSLIGFGEFWHTCCQ